MEEKDIKQVRSNLTKNLINIQKRLFKRDYLLPDYENDYQHLTELKEVLAQIEQLTNLDINLQNELLGKEFHTTDAIGKVDSIKIPLYLYLDTVKTIVEEVLDSTANLSSEKQEVLTTIALLRIKLISLNYNSIFQPNKSLSQEAKDAIVNSKGNFYYRGKEEFNKKIVTIVSAEKKEVYAFKEDKEYVESKTRVIEEEYLTQLKNKVSNYFINNVIPQKSQNIEPYLKDKNLDKTLKKAIIQCVATISNKQFSYKSYEDLLNELSMYESYFREEQSSNTNSNHLFVRYKGTTITEEEKEHNTKQDLDEFESAREEQLKQDEEVRNRLFIQE